MSASTSVPARLRDARDLDPELVSDLLACYSDCGPDLDALAGVVWSYNVAREMPDWLNADRVLAVFLGRLAELLTLAGNVLGDLVAITLPLAAAATEPEPERVAPWQACPECGEDRQDWLGWREDTDRPGLVLCASCGCIWEPPTAAPAPPPVELEACPLCGEALELEATEAGFWREVRCLVCGHIYATGVTVDEALAVQRLGGDFASRRA